MEHVLANPNHNFRTCGGPEALTSPTLFKKCGGKPSSGGQECDKSQFFTIAAKNLSKEK